MHKRTTPNQEILTAATSMLQPYFPGLTNSTLLDALNNYNVSPIQDERETRPMTKKEVAEYLQISYPTVNRYMAKGLLKKIKVGERLVRITRDSVLRLSNSR